MSLVGAVDEEVGDYFPEFLDMLEESPFLKVRGRFHRLVVCLRSALGSAGFPSCS